MIIGIIDLSLQKAIWVSKLNKSCLTLESRITGGVGITEGVGHCNNY